MALRSAHGGGASAVSRVETLPASELPLPPPVAPIERVVEGPNKGRFKGSEAARRLAKMPRRAQLLPRAIATSPEFEPHNNRRRERTRKRIVEFAETHGSVSSGVALMLVHSGWMFAGAEFAAERGALTNNLDDLRTSAQLSAAARQMELTAYEICARETAARPKVPLLASWLEEPAPKLEEPKPAATTIDNGENVQPSESAPPVTADDDNNKE